MKEYGITVDLEVDYEKDSFLMLIKNLENNIISTLKANKILSKIECILPKDTVRYPNDSDHYVFDLIILDFENLNKIDGRNCEIFEDGKILELKDSKYMNLYKIFDEKYYFVKYEKIKKFILLHKHDMFHLKTINGLDVEIKNIDINSPLSVKNAIIEDICYYRKIYKELKRNLNISEDL